MLSGGWNQARLQQNSSSGGWKRPKAAITCLSSAAWKLTLNFYEAMDYVAADADFE
jgi:hypothetical protein